MHKLLGHRSPPGTIGVFDNQISLGKADMSIGDYVEVEFDHLLKIG
jgi:hypothetical protein